MAPRRGSRSEWAGRSPCPYIRRPRRAPRLRRVSSCASPVHGQRAEQVMCPRPLPETDAASRASCEGQRDCGVTGNEISSCNEISVMLADAYMTDLAGLTALAADPSALDEVLLRALTSLERVVPYDLAALYELDGDALTVRTAVGTL